jgi:hypothetical protein
VKRSPTHLRDDERRTKLGGHNRRDHQMP